MRKKIISLFIIAILTVGLITGCGNSGSNNTDSTKNNDIQTETKTKESKAEVTLADGVYTAEFKTDSSMFHVNEAYEGKGTLTVEKGQMMIHVSLVSKKILKLYVGTAEDAQKDGAVLLEPTVDKVTYSDGMTEEVYGFDIPVPYLDKEFDCALVGEKGTWYDHKVSVSEPEPTAKEGVSVEKLNLENGSYLANVTLEGGSGRATIDSPCEIKIKKDSCMAVITWSSPNYDYMIVNDTKYQPVNTEGNSVFEIPISIFDVPVAVQADTTAMSKPHLVDYTLTFDSGSIVKK